MKCWLFELIGFRSIKDGFNIIEDRLFLILNYLKKIIYSFMKNWNNSVKKTFYCKN